MKKMISLIIVCLILIYLTSISDISAMTHRGENTTYQMVRVSDNLIAVMDTRTSRIKTLYIKGVVNLRAFSESDRKIQID